MKGSLLSIDDIKKIAKLANIPISEKQSEELIKQVGVTVAYVSKLQELPTDGVIETSQVTGLENVMREDVVDESRMFSQVEALKNATHTHNGFFVVDAVLEASE
ncbi:MAG: Asp-tRNA(Asn)/Glu-tRNA(Gln) amidotransferase subunit GatC [Patescibacteria group bacterium]